MEQAATSAFLTRFAMPVGATVTGAMLLFVARQITALSAIEDIASRTSLQQDQQSTIIQQMQTNQAVLTELQSRMATQIEQVATVMREHGEDIAALKAREVK